MERGTYRGYIPSSRNIVRHHRLPWRETQNEWNWCLRVERRGRCLGSRMEIRRL